MSGTSTLVPAIPPAGDDVPAIPSLSPSRALDFTTCPRLYRYRAIDRLVEPPSPTALRGTLVHAVLEQLFDVPAEQRTLSTAVALLEPTWQRLRQEDPQAATLFDDERLLADGSGEAVWLGSAAELLERYFALEDPRRYEPASRELLLEVPVSQRLLLRGILDRLDEAPDGRLRVVDYKTGSAPPPGREHRALFQLKFYALMLWRARGVIPSVLRLVYLGDSVIVEHVPTENELLAVERLLLALSETVERAQLNTEYPAVPGSRCSWCAFASRCPEGTAYLESRAVPSG